MWEQVLEQILAPYWALAVSVSWTPVMAVISGMSVMAVIAVMAVTFGIGVQENAVLVQALYWSALIVLKADRRQIHP